ncbi:MAG: hypothetical protein ACJ0NC_02345 [Candidatus Marivariicella sp.]|nr:hypothetical protein [Flavobacteriaceae bacterium]OUV49904.1 MAG: hypothetical protein CBC76_03485 [Flavobacteriaceae bacterium TMED116]|tara:strand:+ start:1834 stop:2238 length:405 start_codon:yes stop_codon:yes gene_type:complete
MWKAYHLIKVSFAAALTGIICCIGPVILFQFGIIGGIYAISFADFFYSDDGSIGFGAVLLRIIALIVIVFGIRSYNKKEDCTSNTKKQKSINKILFGLILLVFTLSIFMTLDEFSSIYFDEYIVPQQQIELNIK